MPRCKAEDFFKRQRCLNSTQKGNDKHIKESFNNLSKSDNKNNSYRISGFLNEICNKSINNFYTYPLQLMQENNADNIKVSTSILENYANSLLYYMDNPGKVLEAINRYSLTEFQVNIITEAVKNLQLVDRVRNNHNYIFEEFDMNSLAEFAKSSKRNVNSILEDVCIFLSEKKIPLYQKFNIALEEGYYLNTIYKLNLESNDIISTISTFYSLTENMSNKEVENMNRVLKESRVFNYDNIKHNIFNLSEIKLERLEYNGSVICITDLIDQFYATNPKTIESLNIILSKIIEESDDLDFRTNFDKGLFLLWNSYRLGTFTDTNSTLEATNEYLNQVIRRVQDSLSPKEEVVRVFIDKLKIFESEIMIITSKDSREYIEDLMEFKTVIGEAIMKLNAYSRMTYSGENIDNIRKCCDKEVEYEDFKATGHSFDRFKYLMEQFRLTKLKDSYLYYPLNQESFYNFMNENGDIDAILAYREYTEEDDIRGDLEQVTSDINQQLMFSNESYLVSYYVLSEGVAEVHLADSRHVRLEKSDIKKIRESHNDSLDYYFDKLGVVSEAVSLLETHILTIDEAIAKLKEAKLDKEEIELSKEALSYIGIDKDASVLLQESFGGNWETVTENIPMEIQMEAYEIFTAIVEKTDIKSKDKKEDSNMSRINRIKLALMGLKSKFKNMSNKTKEWSRNFDNFGNRLTQGIKDALVSDNRENIIKGRVIPSFSKCIKFGIILAGTAFIHPVIPCILAIGGFALSKQLTKKERLLLLDDIEVELDVLDKEIQLAESQNKLKKLRELLKYKKELQRQYQRIRYNIRVGKDIVPSNVGITKPED